MFIVVNVTSKDIKNGFSNDATKNPVALAMQRVVSHHITPTVGSSVVTLAIPNKAVVWTRPTQVQVKSFLKSYTKGETVKPFKFTLQVKGKAMGSVFRKNFKISAATAKAQGKTPKRKLVKPVQKTEKRVLH